MRRFVAAIAGIAVLMSVTTGMASAAGGRLSFTGMILAPTCSPAADAGLKSGDVIMAIDGVTVDEPQSLNYRIATKPIGSTAKLAYVRNGTPGETSVKLEPAPGGTGPAERDVTPEATEAVCGKMMPGFGELMRQESLKYVPTAVLSRQTAGIRGASLIVNLPGKPASIRQCLQAVFPAVPYCVDLIGGPRLETDPAVCKAFRPGA